jgi:hypothetical protein
MPATKSGLALLWTLLIHDSTMERVCEELPGQRTLELIRRPDVKDGTLRFLIMDAGRRP